MTVSFTYTTLVNELQSWAENQDTEFTTALDNIIGLGESKLIKDLKIDLFNTVVSGTFNATSNIFTRPSSLISAETIYYANNDNEYIYLKKRTYEYIKSYWPNASTTGSPLFYTELNETQILVAPTPTTGWTWYIRGITRPAGLSSNISETFLSKFFGDMLFKACLIQSEEWLKESPADAGRIAMFKNEYNENLPITINEVKRLRSAEYELV